MYGTAHTVAVVYTDQGLVVHALSCHDVPHGQGEHPAFQTAVGVDDVVNYDHQPVAAHRCVELVAATPKTDATAPA